MEKNELLKKEGETDGGKEGKGKSFSGKSGAPNWNKRKEVPKTHKLREREKTGNLETERERERC